MTTGTVGSNNLTSLYSNTTSFATGVVNSSVYSVNGGLGVTVNPTTGNVVVSIGQAVAPTDNVQFANITATGNLSNNYYTLANAAGTNGQVLTTNGAGVTTWTTPSSLGLVSSVTGSGAGISVSPTTGAVIVSNTGVTSAVAGTGIGVSAGTGAVTITNSGVTSIVAGSNISISGGTGAVTINAVGFGTGDVVGPASATDNAIARYDGTTGKLIKNSTVTIANTTGTITTNGDIVVNGGDIITGATTASVFNTTATTVDAFGAATALNIGNSGGTTTVNGDLVVSGGDITTGTSTASIFNTTATTVDAFGAATAVNVGNSGGIVTINGDLAVNGGDITTTFGTGNLFNTNAVVVNVGNSATTEVNLGNTGAGRVQIKSPSIVGANTTQAVFNTVATTVNAFGAATTVSIGANTGTTTVNNSLVADDISVTTVDTTNLEVTNIKAKDGTAAASIANTTGAVSITTQLTVDNLNINGNTILSTDTNGNINLTTNGTGDIQLQTDAVVVGTGSSGGIISSRGAFDLLLQTNDGLNSGQINIAQGVNGAITLTPNGTGTVIVSSDLAVNGATSADITTTTTTASVFNTTATTVNVSGAATTTNIGSKTGSSIVNGTNRFTSPTIYGFSGGATTPSRGLMISNGNTGSAATNRNSLVLRTYPVTGGARGNIIFENSRGTETTPTAVQTGDLIAEIVATGYATNGFISDYVTSVPGQAFFTPTENWANTGGPYPTAGTITNAGMGYQLALQPTATTLGAGNAGRINVLNINPQTFTTRSDSYFWVKGKTNSQTMGSLADDGTGKTTFSVSKQDATTSTEYALINFNTYRSSGGTYSPTQSGDVIGQFKFNGNALSGSSPGGTTSPGASITATATETWTTSAQGTQVVFVANKNGATTGSNIIVASPTSTILSSDTITLESSTGNDYLVLNGTTATLTNTAGNPLTGNNISYGRVYGQWQNLNTVTPAASNTAYAFALPTVDFNNIATVGSTSRIIPGAAGFYKLQFSAQVQNDDTADEHVVYFWWRKNGTDVPGSMGRVGIFKAKGAVNGLTIAGWDNMISSANTTDYWELMYAVDDSTHVDFPAFAATAFGPATSSLFVTLVPVGA